jgi:hypothetical protein
MNDKKTRGAGMPENRAVEGLFGGELALSPPRRVRRLLITHRSATALAKVHPLVE